MCKEELIAAQSMLQNNSRLQERLEYVEKKIQSIRTCGNVMSLGFTSAFESPAIERCFLRRLAALGVDVAVSTNEA